MTRQQRRALIADLLRSGFARSQETIARELEAQGALVTQATVSRDLAALGAAKGRDGYYLPESPMTLAPDDLSELESTLRQHAVRISAADSLVVIKTAPGHAGLIGAVLDRTPPSGVVGTIAGDDTIFIATLSRAGAARLAAQLTETLEGAAA